MPKQLPSLVIAFLLGAGTMYAVAVVVLQWSPPTPQLRPATAIRMTPHPWEGIAVNGCQPIEIPPAKFDFVIRLLTPGKYYGDTIFDHITPIVAEVDLTHADGEHTFVTVRDGGHNPAMVSLDGRNYFYGRSDPEILAGGTQLIQLLGEVAGARSRNVTPAQEPRAE